MLSPALLSLAIVLAPGKPGEAAGASGLRARTFTLTYQTTVRAIPDGARTLELWIPWPQSDENQTIHRVAVDVPGALTVAREPRLGNQTAYVRIEQPRGDVTIGLAVTATRRENAGRDETLGPEQRAAYLAAEPLVPLDGPVKALALEATRGLETDAERARALYEKVTSMMKYDKSGTGWGRGDAIFACDARRGNCTDFHALIIGMARSVGIPARFAIGLPLPATRGSGKIDGYHCWAELYVEGQGWVPVDSSEASKDPSKKDYFYGHHDENRIELSRGRHLRLDPPQQGPPLNFFVYPYAEVDGRAHATIDRKFSFVDLDTRTPGR